MIVVLVLASVLAVAYLINSLKGAKYVEYIENLDGKEYPLKSIYTVGYAWSEGLFALKGKNRAKLIRQAKLLYDENYAEYYATLVWAQTISFTHLALCVGFSLAVILKVPLFALLGIACGVVFGYYFLSSMKTKIAERRIECVQELPEIVSSMALLINSGMTLREAWGIIAESKQGAIYDLMRESVINMNNGMTEIEAINRFGVLSDSQDIKKFTSSLIQGIEKGSRDLSNLLAAQSTEMWELKKQIMLQKGEAAASKLLLPIALIFFGVMVLVIAGAAGMLI